jgi:hypothetical protein
MDITPCANEQLSTDWMIMVVRLAPSFVVLILQVLTLRQSRKNTRGIERNTKTLQHKTEKFKE